MKHLHALTGLAILLALSSVSQVYAQDVTVEVQADAAVFVDGAPVANQAAAAPAPPAPPQAQPAPQAPQPPQGYQQQPYPQQGYGQPQGYAPQAQYPVQGQYQLEPEHHPRNLITINPLMLLFGVLSLEYEHGFADWISIAIGPQLLIFHPFDPDSDFELYGLSISARFFILGNAPEGFWAGPTVDTVVASSGGETGVGVGVGAQLGYTWIWGPFTLGIGGGASYLYAEAGSASLGGVLPSLRFSLGAAF